MISDKEYLKSVKLFYSFLESELDFTLSNETINGNVFYDIEYRNSDKVISISYENIEDYLEVIVFFFKEGVSLNYSEAQTLSLKQLNKIIQSKVDEKEKPSNSNFFSNYFPKNDLEKKILKGAKELRLCLKQFNIIHSTS